MQVGMAFLFLPPACCVHRLLETPGKTSHLLSEQAALTLSHSDRPLSAMTRQDVMHAIYFKWKVASGRERDFEQAWLELTELIRDERGGLGSRLHRCADGHYFAYAQWPSELVWAAQPEPTPRMVALRNQMREFAELVDGPLRGDVVADLLISAAPDQGGTGWR
jgi:quinol monooxygenase YgiN